VVLFGVNEENVKRLKKYFSDENFLIIFIVFGLNKKPDYFVSGFVLLL